MDACVLRFLRCKLHILNEMPDKKARIKVSCQNTGGHRFKLCAACRSGANRIHHLRRIKAHRLRIDHGLTYAGDCTGYGNLIPCLIKVILLITFGVSLRYSKYFSLGVNSSTKIASHFTSPIFFSILFITLLCR